MNCLENYRKTLTNFIIVQNMHTFSFLYASIIRTHYAYNKIFEIISKIHMLQKGKIHLYEKVSSHIYTGKVMIIGSF